MSSVLRIALVLAGGLLLVLALVLKVGVDLLREVEGPAEAHADADDSWR